MRTRTALLYRAASAACAREALQLRAHADIWCEEPADVWWTGYEVLQSCGHAAEAQAALQAGVAWVQAGAAQWIDAADRGPGYRAIRCIARCCAQARLCPERLHRRARRRLRWGRARCREAGVRGD